MKSARVFWLVAVDIIACISLLVCSVTNLIQYQAIKDLEAALAQPSVEDSYIVQETVLPASDYVTVEETVEVYISQYDAELLAKTAWGEARGCSPTEIAAVMWCILNRADSGDFPDTVVEVVEAPGQFQGYSEDNPVTDDLLTIAYDVLFYWQIGDDTGRVLPKEYLYFLGDGDHNYFYKTWGDTNEPWDWSLPSVYEEVTDEE